MITIKFTMKVINVKYRKGKAEFISAQIMTKCGETQKSYIRPPNNWKLDQKLPQKLIEDTLESMEKK